MKLLWFSFCLFFASVSAWAQTAPWQPSPGHTQTPLWPGMPPDAPSRAGIKRETVVAVPNKVAGRPWLSVQNVSRPTMTVYTPKGKNTGAAVIVFPGGGYKVLAIDLEGTEICDYLTARGITCILLKYRVPDSGPHWEAKLKRHVTPPAPLALQDAQRTLRLVRFHAAQWNINPHKIGVLGFSAGGHLVAAMSTNFNRRTYRPVDAADRDSCRPDFAVALYPGHLWNEDAGRFELNSDITVTPKTPPTFLVQAENDPVDDVNHSLIYYIALKKASVPVEMHLFAEGGHAFGLRRTKSPITAWPQLMENWLRTIGIIGRMQ